MTYCRNECCAKSNAIYLKRNSYTLFFTCVIIYKHTVSKVLLEQPGLKYKVLLAKGKTLCFQYLAFITLI